MPILFANEGSSYKDDKGALPWKEGDEKPEDAILKWYEDKQPCGHENRFHITQEFEGGGHCIACAYTELWNGKPMTLYDLIQQEDDKTENPMSMDEEIEAWSGFGGEWYEEKQECGHANRYIHQNKGKNSKPYCTLCRLHDVQVGKIFSDMVQEAEE